MHKEGIDGNGVWTSATLACVTARLNGTAFNVHPSPPQQHRHANGPEVHASCRARNMPLLKWVWDAVHVEFQDRPLKYCAIRKHFSTP